jgi:hypothetical protein
LYKVVEAHDAANVYVWQAFLIEYIFMCLKLLCQVTKLIVYGSKILNLYLWLYQVCANL